MATERTILFDCQTMRKNKTGSLFSPLYTCVSYTPAFTSILTDKTVIITEEGCKTVSRTGSPAE